MINLISRFKKELHELGYILTIGLLTGLIGIGVSKWIAVETIAPLKAGAKIQLEGIGAWKGETVVLATSASCKYCQASLKFHTVLINRSHQLGRRIVVFVSKEGAPPDEIVNSLGANDHVVHLDLRKTGISGTPTIAAVDRTGMVTGLWVGKMSESQESTLLARLEGSHTLTWAGEGPDPGSDIEKGLSGSEVETKLAEFLILDIRSRNEHSSTAPRHVNIPVDELAARLQLEVKPQRIVIDCSHLDSSFCQAGRAILAHNAFKEVWLLDDGAVGASCRRGAVAE